MDQKRRVPLEGLELKEYMERKREEQAAKVMREQEAKEEAELKASDVDAEAELLPSEKHSATMLTQQSDLFIRPYSRIPFHLLKRGPKPNAMYRFDKEHNTKDEFGVSVEYVH